MDRDKRPGKHVSNEHLGDPAYGAGEKRGKKAKFKNSSSQ
jgi:hypothetical protein